jgi:hypothetical protein
MYGAYMEVLFFRLFKRRKYISIRTFTATKKTKFARKTIRSTKIRGLPLPPSSEYEIIIS